MFFEKRKYYYTVLIVIFILAIVMFVSFCSTGNYDDTIDIVKEEGWINNTTYSVVGIGRPGENVSGSGARKASSREAALASARRKIIAYFRTLQKEQSDRDRVSHIDAEQRKYNTQKINKALIHGEIIHIRFDAEENCELIYTIHRPDILQLLKGADLHKIECNL